MALSKRLLEEARALGVDVTRYPGQKELRLAVRKALRALPCADDFDMKDSREPFMHLREQK